MRVRRLERPDSRFIKSICAHVSPESWTSFTTADDEVKRSSRQRFRLRKRDLGYRRQRRPWKCRQIRRWGLTISANTVLLSKKSGLKDYPNPTAHPRCL